jgi:D-serine deaminase-like pyridoxal phosphate-dependent protein
VSATFPWWTADDIVIDTTLKAFGADHRGHTVAELAAAGTTVACLPTPLLTLDAAAVEHNIAVMSAFTAAHRVDIAPHGKTTMAPALWRRQLEAGAWAITVATPWQFRVAAAAGVRRVLHAGAVLDPADLRAIADFRRPDPAREVLVWADSPDAVDLISAGYPAEAPPLDVLVDRGGPGSRTGARTAAQALDTARAVAAQPHLRLAGVAGWEGSQRPVGDRTDLRALVGDLCAGLVETYRAATDLGLLDDSAIVTCGGSSYTDIVVETLDPLRDEGARIVIRSGCYLTHDDGLYAGSSPLDPSRTADGLRPALHAWGQVVSRPEPRLALLNIGKRDVPFDSGMPVPQRVRARTRPGPYRPADTDTDSDRGFDPTRAALAGSVITLLNDQHAFLALDSGSDLRVGDIVRCGISHPCTAFDKWSVVPVVADATDDDPVLVGAIRTVF